MFLIATEDQLSEVVATKLVIENGNAPDQIKQVRREGFGYLKSNIRNFAEAANHVRVIVLTDLDQRACAPALVKEWTSGKPVPRKLLLRVAVREVEAWLMADRDGLAAYLGVPKKKLPRDVERIPDPKRSLLRVARDAKREIRRGLLPAKNAVASQGFEYNSLLCHFVQKEWSSTRAAEHSNSLARTMKRLREIEAIEL